MTIAISDLYYSSTESQIIDTTWKRKGSIKSSPGTVAKDNIFLIRPVYNFRSRPDLDIREFPWTRQQIRQRHILPANRENPNHGAIIAQVDELRQIAADENEAFSEESAVLTLDFCDRLVPDFQPSIFLLANGNLRAIWRNGVRDQIGIQFMPNGLLQYVILRDREGITLKSLGEDVSYDKVIQTVEVQGLMGLLFSGQR